MILGLHKDLIHNPGHFYFLTARGETCSRKTTGKHTVLNKKKTLDFDLKYFILFLFYPDYINQKLVAVSVEILQFEVSACRLDIC